MKRRKRLLRAPEGSGVWYLLPIAAPGAPPGSRRLGSRVPQKGEASAPAGALLPLGPLHRCPPCSAPLLSGEDPPTPSLEALCPQLAAETQRSGHPRARAGHQRPLSDVGHSGACSSTQLLPAFRYPCSPVCGAQTHPYSSTPSPSGPHPPLVLTPESRWASVPVPLNLPLPDCPLAQPLHTLAVHLLYTPRPGCTGPHSWCCPPPQVSPIRSPRPASSPLWTMAYPSPSLRKG